MGRPKYYVARTFMIYFLTILTGTLIDSVILAIQQSAPVGILGFFLYGGLITGIACIPLIPILNFGFHYIYKNSINDQHKRKNLLMLCFICSTLPIIFLLGAELIASYRISYETFTWVLLMIPYAISAIFYILYISNKEDLKYPPKFVESVPELDGVLDSGFEDDF